MKSKAVILDRDGVINEAFLQNGNPIPPRSLDELRIILGVSEAIHLLKSHGFIVLCLTNQPDVSRGTMTREGVEEINKHLAEELQIQEIFVCFHDDSDGCECRKPKPGGIEYFLAKYNLARSYTYMIGDRWKDIEAGRAAGVNTVYIARDYAEKAPKGYTFSAPDLLTAAGQIVEGT